MKETRVWQTSPAPPCCTLSYKPWPISSCSRHQGAKGKLKRQGMELTLRDWRDSQGGIKKYQQNSSSKPPGTPWLAGAQRSEPFRTRDISGLRSKRSSYSEQLKLHVQSPSGCGFPQLSASGCCSMLSAAWPFPARACVHQSAATADSPSCEGKRGSTY